MKIGVRKPSIKKSIKARTTGKVKRAIKSSVNPLYSKKGMGYINDPQKAIYNKVYNKTTVGIDNVFDSGISNEDFNKTQSKEIGTTGTVFQSIVAFVQLIVGFGQLIFYGALLIAIIWFTIWFIIQMIKL